MCDVVTADTHQLIHSQKGFHSEAWLQIESAFQSQQPEIQLF
jgi:hypothetical protein